MNNEQLKKAPAKAAGRTKSKAAKAEVDPEIRDRALAMIEEAILEGDSEAPSKLAGLSVTKIRDLVEKDENLRVPLAQLRLKYLKDIEKIAAMNHDGDLYRWLVTRLDKAEQKEKEKAGTQVNVQVNAFLEQFRADALRLATEGLTEAESARALAHARGVQR